MRDCLGENEQFTMFVPTAHDKFSIVIILGLLLVTSSNSEICIPRSFGYGSIVCVCNSTYCDSAAVNVPAVGQYLSYESGKDGKRMSQQKGRISNYTSDDDDDPERITFVVSPDKKFQKILGFGGAFTDATGINIINLSKGTQERIMDAYFGVNGSRYSLGRVPIGSTDFSTRHYSYDDHQNDDSLEKFNLTREDFEYKIPLMQKGLSMNPNLRFISAAWTAPLWMKTNANYTEGNGPPGFLKSDYYQIYAEYLLKFINEYKKNGLKIWALSTANEPRSVLELDLPNIYKHLGVMGWTSFSLAHWIANNLGPTISRSESKDTLIIVLDDQRSNLPWFADDVFDNSVAKKYIAGIGVHWYKDNKIGPEVLDTVGSSYPDKFLILTEACEGADTVDYPKVRLGDWNRGQKYILNIMENLNHGVTGWIDWNLALDKQGGPNWIKNYVDSTIIVDHENDQFFKQPTYYALAHFSKFVKTGSTRIGITHNADIKTIAFLTPDDEIVIILYNQSNKIKSFTVKDQEQGNIATNISAYSIKTIIYKQR